MNEHLNAKTASFVMTILQMEKPKYSYGRKPKGNKVFDTIISLPATPSGEPDWKYMEDFIWGLHSEPLKTSVKSSHIPLETEKWGEFRVEDLFDVERGTRLVSDEREDGNIPLVTAGENNEGVSDIIHPTINKVYENKIGIDMFGNAFYHSGKFACDDNILVLLEKMPISDCAKLFVSVVLSKDKYRYSYGNIDKRIMPRILSVFRRLQMGSRIGSGWKIICDPCRIAI